MVEEDPSISNRQIINIWNVSNWIDWKILEHNYLYQCHIQYVKALLPAEIPPGPLHFQ